MSTLRRFIDANSFSLTFGVLFLLCLAGQLFCGLKLYNDAQVTHGLGKVGALAYAGTGDFLEGVFANWQAAVLQLGCLIFFGVYLHQEGAPHSRKAGKSGPRGDQEGSQDHQPDGGNQAGATATRAATARDAAPGQNGDERSWCYRNSLSLAFFGLSLLYFALHFFAGHADFNATRALDRRSPLSFSAFAISAKFWFETFQTWQAEFMAITVYMLLSIVLRQQGSPESKPVDAPDSDTGDVNK